MFRPQWALKEKWDSVPRISRRIFSRCLQNMSKTHIAVRTTTQGLSTPRISMVTGAVTAAHRTERDIYQVRKTIGRKITKTTAAAHQSISQIAAAMTAAPLPPRKRYHTG